LQSIAGAVPAPPQTRKAQQAFVPGPGPYTLALSHSPGAAEGSRKTAPPSQSPQAGTIPQAAFPRFEGPLPPAPGRRCLVPSDAGQRRGTAGARPTLRPNHLGGGPGLLARGVRGRSPSGPPSRTARDCRRYRLSSRKMALARVVSATAGPAGGPTELSKLPLFAGRYRVRPIGPAAGGGRCCFPGERPSWGPIAAGRGVVPFSAPSPRPARVARAGTQRRAGSGLEVLHPPPAVRSRAHAGNTGALYPPPTTRTAGRFAYIKALVVQRRGRAPAGPEGS